MASRTNYCLQSQAINVAPWSSVRASRNGDVTTDPDGNSTADSLIEDATASDTHFMQQTFATLFDGSSTYVVSIYAKPNGRDRFRLDLHTAAFPTTNATFNVATGDLVSKSATATAGISSAGAGWYRCYVSNTSDAAVSAPVQIFLDGGAGVTYNGDGASGMYFWQAQLEVGSTPTDPILTTTEAVTVNDRTRIIRLNFGRLGGL